MSDFVEKIKYLKCHSQSFFKKNKELIRSLIYYWTGLVRNLTKYLHQFEKQNILKFDR